MFLRGPPQRELDAAVKSIGKAPAASQSDVSKLADLDRLYSTVERTRRE